jgi:hypothetical protein
VARSPPGAILQLLLFTASVAAAVLRIRAAQLLQSAAHTLSGLWRRVSGTSSGGGARSTAVAASSAV